MAKLKTEWKRIGRSGPTVDGRTIEPTILTQVAKNYDKELFTALIWPDHNRWLNFGTVEDLRAEKNTEGGVDLFAILSPNENYLYENKYGQYLFTSMELMPNFRESGEWYLTGMAATDKPASAATSEMRFAKIDDKNALVAVFTENQPYQFSDDEEPGWFKRFTEKFTQKHDEEDDMSKAALEALAARFTALEQKLEAGKQDGDGDNTPADDIVSLTAKIDALTEKVTLLTAKPPEALPNVDQFTALKDELKALRDDFTKAVNATDGTPAGDHYGDGTDLSIYI